MRSAEEDEVGSAYQVASATMRGNGSLATPGIRCPAHVIGDTGTGVHIIGRNGLTESEISHIDDTGPSVRLNAADGVTKTQDRLIVKSKALSGQFEAIVLKSSPNAISVGHYCMELGYYFKWPPGKDPYFVKPNGDKVRFYVHGNVPYLDEEHSVPALPAGDEEGGEIEVLQLQSGDLVPGGNVSVGSDVEPGDAPVSVQKDLKAIALSREHLLTHLPKNPWCHACQRSKVNAKRARRKANKAARLAEIRVFGDLVTADHLVSKNDVSAGIDDESFGMVILDHATTWVETHPACAKSADEAALALDKFMGRQKIRVMYTDNAPELVKAIAVLKIQHDTSTPYRSTTNGVAERMNRKVIEGTRAVLTQAGLSARWWPHAVKHFCFSLNISVSDGDSAYNLRHGNGHFRGHKVPFGSLVDFRPPKVLLKQFPKFEKTTMPGILLGYHVGLGGKWKGDYLVTPLQDWQSENAGGTLRIFRVKEVVIESNRQVQFPLSPVKEHMERTLGPHGESTTVELEGIAEPVKLSNKEPSKWVYLSDGDADDGTGEAQRNDGAGVRKRYASTTRPRVSQPKCGKIWERPTRMSVSDLPRWLMVNVAVPQAQRELATLPP